MAIKQAMETKMTQGPVMTPELRQAIKILAMPTQDLSTFISTELMENPFLQDNDGMEETDFEEEFLSPESDITEIMEQETLKEDLPLDYEWDNVYESVYESDSSTSSATGNTQNFSTADLPEKEQAEDEKTLTEHLNEQLIYAVKTPTDLFLGRYIIDAMDDAGYLHINVKETSQRLNVPRERMEDIIAVIQTFDPVGVGSQDLATCLRLQMHAADNLTDTAEIVLQNLSLLAKKDYTKLAKLTKTSKKTILETLEDISKCNPKPGLAFGNISAEAIVPDVMVFQKEAKLRVELNAEALPKVLLNNTATGIFTGADKNAKSYISERTSRANWLVKSLEQRARTILKVSRAIVNKQADFFTYGAENLTPMTLHQIAEIVEVHESTVSRVTNGKYMQTPLGTFELKHFFSAGISTTGGNVEVAAASVKAIIKRLIENEDARKPLSDEKLVGILKTEGIKIARRTVAKYREAQNIPSSSGRRIR